MLQPSAATVGPCAAAQLLHEHFLPDGLWDASQCSPCKRFCRRHRQPTPKIKGEERRQDQGLLRKAHAARTEPGSQSLNIRMCAHGVSWSNRTVFGLQAGRWEVGAFISGGWRRGRRHGQQWHFNEGVMLGGKESSVLSLLPISPFVNNVLARVVCEQVLAFANINILSKASGEAWYGLGCAANTSLVAPSHFS